jgi:predicted  nucleic acid-binding Zn-ribbon protein
LEDAGIKLAVDGEREFKNAIKDINSELGVLTSELKKVSSEYLDNAKSQDALTAKNQVLVKEIDAQKNKIDELKKAVEYSSAAHGENSKETQKWQAQLNSAQTVLNKMEHELSNNNKALDEYAKFSDKTVQSVGKLDNEISGLNNSYAKTGGATENLKDKQEILGDVLEKQNDKVDVLKNALETSKSAYGENSEETKKWQDALNSASSEVDQTKSQIKDLGSQMEEAKGKSSQFGDVFKGVFTAEATIKAIGMIADGVKQLGSALAGAVTGAASYADEMLTLSTKTGVSTQSLQEFSAVTELLDVDLSTFTSSLTKNTKSMYDAQSGTGQAAEAYAKLGVSVTDSSGALLSSEEVFWTSIDALAQMSNATERDALSMQLFGKSAMELNPLIAEGSQGFADLSQKAHDMGLVMGDEALVALGNLDDSMNLWNGTIQGLSNTLAANLAPEFANIVNSASGAAQAFAGFIGSIGTNDGSFETNLENLKTSVLNFFQVFSESETTTKILGWGLILAGAIIALAPIIGAAVSFVMAIVTGSIAVWPIALIAALLGGLIVFWPQISEWLSGIWENLKIWGAKTWNNIINWFVSLKDGAVNKAKEMIDAVIDWFKGLPGKIKDSINDGVTIIKNWGTDMVAKGKQAAIDLWNAIVDKITGLPNEIKNTGENLVKGLWDGINGMINWVKNKIKGFADSVTGWIKGFFGIQSPSKLFRDQIGKNLALGLGEGFTDEMGTISEEMASSVPTAFDMPEVNANSPIYGAQALQNASYPNGLSANAGDLSPNSEGLISALQKALQGMAFEIDGDKMGQLVVSKVERVVFA